jgi:hypothetical protein
MGLLNEQISPTAEKLFDKFLAKFGVRFSDDAAKAAERIKFENNLGSRFDDLERLDQELAAGTKAQDEIESALDNFLDDTEFFNSFERTIASNPLMYKEFAVKTVENILRSQDVLDDMKKAINASRTKDEALRKVDKFLENFMGANAQDYTQMFEKWVEKNYDPSIARKASTSGRQKYGAIADDWEQVKKMKGASEALKDPVKQARLEKIKKKFDSLTEDEWMVMEKEIETNWREIEAKLKHLDPNFFQKGWYKIPEKRRKMIPWIVGATILFPLTIGGLVTNIPTLFKKVRELDKKTSEVITGDDTKNNGGGNQNQNTSQDQFMQNAVAYDSRMNNNIVKVGDNYFVKLSDNKLLLLKMENNKLYLKDDSGKWIDTKTFK